MDFLELEKTAARGFAVVGVAAALALAFHLGGLLAIVVTLIAAPVLARLAAGLATLLCGAIGLVMLIGWLSGAYREGPAAAA